MPTTELKVDGMNCGSCFASVARALTRVPRVEDVEVDLASGIAQVGGEHAVQRVPEQPAALGEVGYKAHLARGTPAAHQHWAVGSGGDAGAASKGRGGCCRR